jgi:PWI domain.
MERKIRPWINKKIIEYIGEPEPTLVDFICSKVLAGSAPQGVLDDVQMVSRRYLWTWWSWVRILLEGKVCLLSLSSPLFFPINTIAQSSPCHLPSLSLSLSLSLTFSLEAIVKLSFYVF